MGLMADKTLLEENMSKHEGVSIESMQNETENKDTRKNEK
jgi:recombinational DNA repair protein RecT